MTDISIIGPGAVGKTIAKKLLSKNKLTNIFGKDNHSSNKELKLIFENKLKTINQNTKLNGVVFLCVKDDDLKRLVDLINNDVPFENCFFIHTSGTLNKNILLNLKKNNSRIAAAHPYQSFYFDDSIVLNNLSWGCDVEEKDYEDLKYIINLLDGKAIKLNHNTLQKKELYHISAVASSNFLSLILYLSKKFCDEAGIEFKDFAPKITETTLKNNLKSLSENDFALTGPVARGEVKTLESHINALKSHTELSNYYKELSALLATIARQENKIDLKTYEEFMDILIQKEN